MAYTIDDARHQFSAWAASRAAQAGSAKAKRTQLIRAIEYCGVPQWLSDKEDANRALSYGVAAKLLSTYVKSAFVLAGFEQTPLARAVHPPIDSILLKAVDRRYGRDFSTRLKWQRLTAEDYRRLISDLRTLTANRAFWQLEEDWTP